MNSQVNNQSDKQEVFKEKQFRPIFFEQSSGTATGGETGGSPEENTRMEEKINKDDKLMALAGSKRAHDAFGALASGSKLPQHSHSRQMAVHAPHNALSHKKRRAPKFVRRFRSRSLPVMNYTKNFSQIHHIQKTNQPATAPSLPPINLQNLKEIDLHEILKNPQLRHDILFDPQLQFRPNLDGERGKRKESMIDMYWSEVEKECAQFFVESNGAKRVDGCEISRLPVLFTTLRDILLSMLPYKDRSAVTEVMDSELLVQQLSHGAFDFVALSQWLGHVFKLHCAPMRDQWVLDMMAKFKVAYEKNSVKELVQGLRMIFLILEAMKLDVANHQIRILRPVLVETAVDFEKDYFNQLLSNKKFDITDSLRWFYKLFHKKFSSMSEHLDQNDKFSQLNLKILLVASIVDFFSCCNMAIEFPFTLAFDHTRLVLLRADVRQLVCVQLCVVLYKQLVLNCRDLSVNIQEKLKPEKIKKVQEEIIAIVSDSSGNMKWTRNVHPVALQIVKNVLVNVASEEAKGLSPQMIDFASNWLIKQIQPTSQVYKLMEERVFKDLVNEIVDVLRSNNTPVISSALNAKSKGVSKMSNIAYRVATLVNFHWSVFGDYYAGYLKTNS